MANYLGCLPESAGWYWKKEPRDKAPKIVAVKSCIGPDGIRYAKFFEHESLAWHDVDIVGKGTEWVGPISTPERFFREDNDG